MAKRIRPDCTKTYLFPPSLEDFVPPFYPVRFIRAFVEKLGLKALGFAEEDGEIGRPRYSVDLLWKVILYGYDPKIRSYRELERMGMAHLGTMWLNGIVYLDHSTIVRSFQAHRERIKAVLRKRVELTYEGGALGMVADGRVDRKRVGANVRRGRALPWEDLEAVTKRLREMVEDLFGKGEDEEDGAERRGCPLPEALRDKGKRRAFTRAQMGRAEGRAGEAVEDRERAGVLKEKELSRKKEEVEQKVAAAKEKIALSDEAGTGHVSFVDGDARMMKIGERIEL